MNTLSNNQDPVEKSRVAPHLEREIPGQSSDSGNHSELAEKRPAGLPEPPYPENKDAAAGHMMSQKQYAALNRHRNIHAWLVPYLRSKALGRQFRPILSYIFTDWKCNIDCHYCWAFNNAIPGMTEEMGKHSIDWLHSIGCRVGALMGGEPLVRPGFIQKLVSYGSGKGFFMYLPTNGRLMKPDAVDRIGDAGVAVWNVAVDAVREKAGLPKAFEHIRSNFDYLVRMQHRYGYLVFFNINICRNNIEDVKELTEIARSNGIATDYHINESPIIHQGHFTHSDNNPTFIMPHDFPAVDDLLDHLIGKNRSGYKMVNSVQHFIDMKKFLRGHVDKWECRAGHNTTLIRTDGTLAPCFSMYSSSHDWGSVGNPKFDFSQLDEMKRVCRRRCLSTCQHTTGHAYNLWRVIKWLAKQAARGFQETSGSF